MGHVDVDAMLDAIPDRTLREWMAYDRVDGLAYPWLQTGVLAAIVGNASGNLKKKVKPADFMPIRAVRAREPMDPRKIMAGFKAAADACGKTES
jgi:hypothetical protein